MASSCHQRPPGLASGKWEVWWESASWNSAYETWTWWTRTPAPSPLRWNDSEMHVPVIAQKPLLALSSHCLHKSPVGWHIFEGILYVCLSFPPSLRCPPACVSWGHLQNKLLALESLSRCLLLRELKLRHYRTGEDKLVTWFWFAWDGGIPGRRDFQCQSLENLVKTGISWPPLQENSAVSGKLGEKKTSGRKGYKVDQIFLRGTS